MAASLIDALALPSPAGGRKPTARGGPTGPLRAPGVTPREEVPGARKAPQAPPTAQEPSDAEIERAKAVFASSPTLGAPMLANAAARIADRARRDPIVRALREGLVRIDPFHSRKESRAALDKALDELVEKGLSKGFLKLLEATIGKEAVEVKRPDPTVPPVGTQPDEAPGEHIVTKDFDLDKGSEAVHFVLAGAPLRVKAGQSFGLTVHTPTRWKANQKRWQNTEVVIGRAADKTQGRALRGRPITKKGANAVVLEAPDTAGRYLIYVVSGAGPEPRPVHDLEVLP